MQMIDWKKAVAGVIATVFLGALGSGLWEIAIRPGGFWFWHGVLTAATFGSKYLKDQVYLEAAKGNHEAAAQYGLMILGIFVSFGSGILTSTLTIVRQPAANRKNVDTPETPGLAFKRRAVGRSKIWSIRIMLLLPMVFYLVGALKAKAANDAYTYFRQSADVCRPYMRDRQSQLLVSRFAALRSRDEYIGITDELKNVSASNHLTPPDFSPW